MPVEQFFKLSSGLVLWGGENYIADNLVKILLLWIFFIAGSGAFFYFSRRYYRKFAAQAGPIPPAPDLSVWRWLPLLLFFAGALWVRLNKLGLESLDSQELSYYIKAIVSKNILMVIFAPFMASPHPPLFTLIMYLWSPLSDSPAYLRLPAVFFGAATVPLLYSWISQRTNHIIAAAAGLLLAISPLHVYYSQSIMPYSLLCLLIVGAYYLHHRVLDGPDRHYRTILYSLTLAGGFLCHFSFSAFIAPLFLETLWTAWRSPKAPADWRRFLKFAYVLALAVLIFAVFSIGLIIYFIAGVRTIMPVVNQMDLFLEYPGIGVCLLNFIMELGAFNFYGLSTTFGSRLTPATNLFSLTFILLGLWWWNRSHRGLPWHMQWPLFTGMSFYLANGLITIFLHQYFYFAMRRFIPLLPFLYFLLAYGLWTLTQLLASRARRLFTYALAGGAFLTVISWQAVDLTQTLLVAEKADTENAVAYLKRNLREGDAIAVGPYSFFESMFNFSFKRNQPNWMTTLGPGHWRHHMLWKDNKPEYVNLFYPLHNTYRSWDELLENVFLQRVWLVTIEETPYGWRELLGCGSVTAEPFYRAGFSLADQVNYQLVTVSRFQPSPRQARLDAIQFGANDYAQARGFLPTEQIRCNKRLIVHNASVVFAEAANVDAFTLEIERYAYNRDLDLIIELSTPRGKSTLQLHTQPGISHLYLPVKTLPAEPGDDLTITFQFDEEHRDLFPECVTEDELICGIYIYNISVKRKTQPQTKL